MTDYVSELLSLLTLPTYAQTHCVILNHDPINTPIRACTLPQTWAQSTGELPDPQNLTTPTKDWFDEHMPKVEQRIQKGEIASLRKVKPVHNSLPFD